MGTYKANADTEFIFKITICTEDVAKDGTLVRRHWMDEYVSDLSDTEQVQDAQLRLIHRLKNKIGT